MSRLHELKLEGLAVGDKLLGERTTKQGLQIRNLMLVTGIGEDSVMLKLIKYEATFTEGGEFEDRTHVMSKAEEQYGLHDRKWTIVEKVAMVSQESVNAYVAALKQENERLQSRLINAINDAEEKERELAALKERVTKHFTEKVLGEL